MNRKPRKDSILHNLPPEQRAKVDKWLFDKGLSYAQVAESCARFLGVQVSKSSVARYYQRAMEGRVERKRAGEAFPRGHQGKGVEGLLKGAKWPGVYPRFVEGLMAAAGEAMERYEFELRHEGYVDLKEARWIVKLMQLIIAARRAEHAGTVAAGERAQFETAVARMVLRMPMLKKGEEVRSPLARVQRGNTFIAQCARWDARREREFSGGRKRWW